MQYNICTIRARDLLKFVRVQNYIYNHGRCKICSRRPFQIRLIINSFKRSSIRSVLSVKSLRIQRVSLLPTILYVGTEIRFIYLFFFLVSPILYNTALLFLITDTSCTAAHCWLA